MESKTRLIKIQSIALLGAYGLAGLMNVLAHASGIQWLVFPSKIVLMPLLMGHLLLQQVHVNNKKGLLLILALGGSWAGDILLELADGSIPLFLLGMGAFLFAHILYIIFFTGIQNWSSGSLSKRPIIITPFALYLLGLFTFLDPYLEGIMKPSVYIYGIFITIMTLSAFNTITRSPDKWQWVYIAGTILFMLSDTMIAIRNFYPGQIISQASAWIMLTYILAQAGIITGIVNSTKWEK